MEDQHYSLHNLAAENLTRACKSVHVSHRRRIMQIRLKLDTACLNWKYNSFLFTQQRSSSLGYKPNEPSHCCSSLENIYMLVRGSRPVMSRIIECIPHERALILLHSWANAQHLKRYIHLTHTHTKVAVDGEQSTIDVWANDFAAHLGLFAASIWRRVAALVWTWKEH